MLHAIGIVLMIMFTFSDIGYSGFDYDIASGSVVVASDFDFASDCGYKYSAYEFELVALFQLRV